MTQRDFDEDLTINFDDTGCLMRFPEQEEGFDDNPIAKLFDEIEEEEDNDEE
jgi:hypothetical protein